MDLSLALLWSDIASQALSVPENLLQKDVLDLLDSLLRDAGRFYSCHLGENDEKWDVFVDIQKVR